MQFQFNEAFNDIVPNITSYYSKINKIPKHIKEFIKKNLKEQTQKEKDYNYIESYNNYYEFDFSYGILLLYHFVSIVNYSRNIPKITIEIQNIYYMTEHGIQELTKNKYFSYEQLHKKIINNSDDDIGIINRKGFLYDNLDLLKQNNLYKYSFLWDLKKYCKKEQISLYALTLYPIYYPQFEYLIKMKLFNLACDSPYKYNKINFQDNFEIDKKYYPLMKDIDICEEELSLLQTYPYLNKEEMLFFSNVAPLAKELSHKTDLKKLKRYFYNQNLSYQYLYEYNDYLKLCVYFGLNIRDKNILFPNHLISSHNSLLKEYEIIKNKELNIKIKALATILNINKYEDDIYIIFPAYSIENLIDESAQMCNCIRTYMDEYSNNNCQIYFMRYKNKPEESLVTIEVKDNKINQARMKYNKEITENIKLILEVWEQHLIPIYNI